MLVCTFLVFFQVAIFGLSDHVHERRLVLFAHGAKQGHGIHVPHSGQKYANANESEHLLFEILVNKFDHHA
jgi:hypothetical protein